MDPFTLSLLLGAGAAAAPVVGELAGYAFGGGDRDKAESLMDQAQQEYGGINAPTVPETDAHLDPSAMQAVGTDPRLEAAQMQALEQLQHMGMEGSNNLTFRAGMDAATRATNREANARDAALQEELGAKGMGNSGVAYALRQRAGQDANDRIAAGGFQSALAGRQAALQALQAGAGLAGDVRNQQFGERSRRAEAADEIARWNAGHLADARQQRFGNQMQLATARTNFATNRANQLRGQAGQIQQIGTNAGLGAGQAFAAAGQYANGYDPNRKRMPA